MTIGRDYNLVFVDKARELLRQCEALTGPTSEDAHFADVGQVHQQIRPLLVDLSQMVDEMTGMDISVGNPTTGEPPSIATGVHIEGVPGWTKAHALRTAINGLPGIYEVQLVGFERGTVGLRVHHASGLDMVGTITGVPGFSLIELGDAGEEDDIVLRFAYLAFQAA